MASRDDYVESSGFGGDATTGDVVTGCTCLVAAAQQNTGRGVTAALSSPPHRRRRRFLCRPPGLRGTAAPPAVPSSSAAAPPAGPTGDCCGVHLLQETSVSCNLHESTLEWASSPMSSSAPADLLGIIVLLYVLTTHLHMLVRLTGARLRPAVEVSYATLRHGLHGKRRSVNQMSCHAQGAATHGLRQREYNNAHPSA